ncbi:MAG: hypothetical protein EOP48_32935 [Sphingobacteriales bacterium]|nr:MAG: hypothetical protein EOP48_32935 [Sphingobacteriales bacterium]
MRLKLSALLLSLCYGLMGFAQEKINLNSQDGIHVSYELTRIDSGAKKETYLAVLKAENKNDFDVYYGIPLTKHPNGTIAVNILQGEMFSQASVRNGTGMFGDNINLKGNVTRISTNDNFLLYNIPKAGFVTAEKEFKVKAGAKPIITNTFLVPLKSIDQFDIAMNAQSINGDWVSSCGNMQMTLTYAKDDKGNIVLQQLINGKQNIWTKTSANSFAKSNDNSTTLSYNNQNNSFSYSTTDGVSCVWSRK